MRKTKVAYIDVDKQVRVQRLVKEYAHFSFDELKAATDRILKRLGGQHHKAAIEALENGDFSYGTDIALNYYDKTYLHGLSRREPEKVTTFVVTENNPSATAARLIAGI